MLLSVICEALDNHGEQGQGRFYSSGYGEENLCRGMYIVFLMTYEEKKPSLLNIHDCIFKVSSPGVLTCFPKEN